MKTFVPLILMPIMWFIIIYKPFAQEEKMSSIKTINDMQLLIKQVQDMDIGSSHKERIIKVIDFEKYMMEGEIIKELGSKAYESLKQEEKS